MLASNGITKPLPASIFYFRKEILKTKPKAPEGFEPSSPTLKVGNFPFVHNAHS